MFLWAGTTNTAVLITSSLTLALAVQALQMGRRRALMIFLVLNIALTVGKSGYLAISNDHGAAMAIQPNDGDRIFEQLVESAPDAVIVIDASGTIQLVVSRTGHALLTMKPLRVIST